MRIVRAWAILGVGAAIALSLVGCSPTADDTTQPRPHVGADEFASNMQSCLNDLGYDVKVFEDGSVGISLPDAQMPAYNDAEHECAVKFGYDQTPSLSDGQKAELYGELTELVDCLEAQGYPISDVPSEQAFVDGADLVPYEQVPTSVVGEDWDKLQETCPQPQG